MLPWALLLPALAAAHGGACVVTTQPVNFGAYDTFDASPSDSTGTVEVSCGDSRSYTISLSPGGGGSFASRRMNSGVRVLDYNLYVDASRASVWGDGSGATAIVSGTTSTTAIHTVYGRIPAGQNAYVGSYADTITVTLEF